MKTEIVKWTTKIGQEIAKNSPKILTGLAVAGTVTTSILAGKASIDAYKKMEEIKEVEEGRDEPFTTKEKAKEILPLYIPTGIMLITTAACIIGSHEISARRQMALASAYSLSTEAMKEMQNKVEETYGKKKAEKLRDDINEDRLRTVYPTQQNNIIATGYGDTLFMDKRSGQLMKSDWEHVKRAFLDMETAIKNGGEVSLNRLYSELGFRCVKDGEDWVWDTSRGADSIDPKYTTAMADEDRLISCTVIDWWTDPVPVC